MISSPIASTSRKGVLSSSSLSHFPKVSTLLRYPGTIKGSNNNNNNNKPQLIFSILLCSGLLFLNLLIMVLVLNFRLYHQIPTSITTPTTSSNEFQNSRNVLSSSTTINNNANTNLNHSELMQFLQSRRTNNNSINQKQEQCNILYNLIKMNQT